MQDEESISIEIYVMRKLGDVSQCRHLAVPSLFFAEKHNDVAFTAFRMPLLQMDLYELVLANLLLLPENIHFLFPNHRQKTFLPSSVLSILGQGFSAIGFLEAKGFVYGDVKLENFMVKTFRVKQNGQEKELVLVPEVLLIDLNTVFEFDDELCLCPTVSYRSPEIILDWFSVSRVKVLFLGYKARPKIDSWSMGLLALELLSKRLAINIDYEDNEKIHEHIVRIEGLLGVRFPNKMLDHGKIDVDLFPPVPENQPKKADILKELVPSHTTKRLHDVINRLLMIDPTNRPSPSEAAELLKKDIFLP